MECVDQVDALVIGPCCRTSSAHRNTMYRVPRAAIPASIEHRSPSGTPVHWPIAAPALDAIVPRDLGACRLRALRSASPVGPAAVATMPAELRVASWHEASLPRCRAIRVAARAACCRLCETRATSPRRGRIRGRVRSDPISRWAAIGKPLPRPQHDLAEAPGRSRAGRSRPGAQGAARPARISAACQVRRLIGFSPFGRRKRPVIIERISLNGPASSDHQEMDDDEQHQQRWR